MDILFGWLAFIFIGGAISMVASDHYAHSIIMFSISGLCAFVSYIFYKDENER